MAQLAIKGHKTRGKEVIQLLETLGGSNFHNYSADCDSLCFYIGESSNIIYYDWVNSCYDVIVHTLEEFEEKFPYKVGDKVQRNGAISCGSVYVIEQMKWEDNQVKYVICDLYWKNCKCTVTSKDLQPYKEETVETLNNKTNKAIFETNAQACDIMNDIIKKDMKEIKIDIPKGYEFFGIDDDNKIILTEKQPQYPKDYEECCEVLGISDNRGFGFINLSECENILMSHFIQFKRCRDAYWKVYGEQMGLGKPWEPDWKNENEIYYTISHDGVNIKCYNYTDVYSKLAFPTAEMRDAFFENFKGLIEQCKELL